jgi:hypothetical protein
MPTSAPQVHEISTSETRNVAVDLAGKLDSGELLSGTPTVVEVETSELVLGSKVVNTAELTINGRTVAVGEAVQFTCDASSATQGQARYIDITCDTDASQTVHVRIRLQITT